jgi:hypothetical protein
MRILRTNDTCGPRRLEFFPCEVRARVRTKNARFFNRLNRYSGVNDASGNFCRALTNRQATRRRLPLLFGLEVRVSRSMKVNGPGGVSSAGAPKGPARAAASGFSLPGVSSAGEAAPASQVAAPVGVSSIDALLALQEVGGPLERRRKAVRRAGVILDVLDEVKLALLEGDVPPAALDRLMSAVRLERGGADDPKLQGLLDEIETRAAVELAKIEISGGRA